MPVIKISPKFKPSIAFEKIKDTTSTIEQGFTIKLRSDPYYRNEVIIIEKSLKALEIIQEHKLLNYVIKNPKCAAMYHLTNEEIKILEEVS